MGFYPPDALVQEAQRRDIRVAPPDVNRSRVPCHVETVSGLPVRIGLGYVKGVRREEMEMLVAERERGGAYAGIADLASRSGAGIAGLERLAWAGALDGIPVEGGGERREALWRIGVTANGRGGTLRTQLALPIEPPEPPPLESLGDWGKLIADYRSTGIALGSHPMELMRPGIDPALLCSSELERAGDGSTVEVAGMVVARQRPGTAKGIVFMTLEDERGIVNVIVPKRVYERHRATVRSAVMVRARGRLERREGVTNVLVDSVEPLERGAAQPQRPCHSERSPARPLRSKSPSEPSSRRARELAVAELRAVAPAGHSFGRRGR